MYQYKIANIRVIDGDTVECDVDLGFSISIREKFRLANTNCPELSTPSGPTARAYTTQWLLNRAVILSSIKSPSQDKYGRWLGIFQDALSNATLNNDLVTSGNAVPYMVNPTL